MPTKKVTPEELAPEELALATEKVLTEEHEVPADGVVKEALPDGSETELVADEAVGLSLATVRALVSFHDLETKRDYRAGDIVPWDLERARHYAARGLVAIEE